MINIATDMTDHTRPLWADLPYGDEINALLDALLDLTDDEVETHPASTAAWYAPSGAAWDAAWLVALDVERPRPPRRRRRRRPAAWGTVRDAVLDAVLALVVADLVGQHGLTREHLDILTARARVVPRLATIIDRALPTTTMKEN